MKILRLTGMSDKDLADFMVDIFEGKVHIDYYSNLRLNQMTSSTMLTNFLI